MQRAASDTMQIDLVRSGEYLLFVFKDDLYYTGAFSPNDRNKTIDDLASHQAAWKVNGIVRALHADAMDAWDIQANPYHFMIGFYAKHYKTFLLCDVGSHLGETTMDATKVALSAGGQPRVFAFDCGVASALTWRNFENNGFMDICFTEAAVGLFDGHTIMYREKGYSVDNKVINSTDQSFSFPVRCIKLDTFLEQHNAFGPACIKIDTQGAEPGVLAGMVKTLEAGPITMQLEFTPWAMRKSQVDPVSFAEQLNLSHHLFILGHNNNKFLPVHTARDLVINADAGEPFWSDVLAVPRNLPQIDALLMRFEKFYLGQPVTDPRNTVG